MYADDANIIITATNITEINQKLKELCSKLLEWVDDNGLKLNLKKTKYIIFSRQKSESILPEPLIITDTKIEQKQEARFLGVIVDGNLTWKKHISTLHSKMSRYIGIMYKLKSILPLKTRIQIYHSFVQSHINYCSLVWGFSAKSHIEILFRAQKRGMRAIVPGYIQYSYKDGVKAGHTKPFFTEYGILTVQGMIVANALLFMIKTIYFPFSLPDSVRATVANDSPVIGSDHITNQEWLTKYLTHVYQNSLFCKGPLLLVSSEFSEIVETPIHLSINFYKKEIKNSLLLIQSMADLEWRAVNFPLYRIPGLRKAPQREVKKSICYEE